MEGFSRHASLTTSMIPAIIKRHKLVTIISLVILIPVTVFVLWAWITLSYTYSSGERAGFLQKVSKKGWVCKTWEGELAMVNIPGALQERWQFTVRNDSIAQLITRSMGKQVTLSYDQHVKVPTSCFGDTPYFVTNVHNVGP